MLKLAAFADEISPQLAEQIRVCKQLGITHFELRSVEKINVLDFDATMRKSIKDQLQSEGLGVACIGSPIGKVKLDDSWETHFDRFKIAVDLAEWFEAPMIRIFSYYAPASGGDVLRHRDEVIRRMNAKVEYVKDRSITLVHENEKNIFGEKGRDCVDVMRTVNSPKLRSAFDFANFVQAGEKPLENWPSLKPYTTHIHIKDALLADGSVVPAGEGDGQLGPILVDAYQSGYRGFLSLEPHLSSQGQFSGFSGAALFETAVTALRTLCRKIEIPLAS